MNRDAATAILPAKAYQDIEYDSPTGQRRKRVLRLHDERGHTKLAFCSLQGEVKQLATIFGGGGLAYSFGASFTVAATGVRLHLHRSQDAGRHCYT